MRERVHEAYIGLAGVIAAGGITWLAVHHTHHGFWDGQRIGAAVFIGIAGLIFLGVFLNALPGLRHQPDEAQPINIGAGAQVTINLTGSAESVDQSAITSAPATGGMPYATVD
jgi:cytochrome c biogenesis protein CcdA